jgi:ATP-dependent protease Clp ATPase subunit
MIERSPRAPVFRSSQYQRLFEMEGVHLTMAAEALGAIARKAYTCVQGPSEA